MREDGVQDATYLLRKLLVTHGPWLGDEYTWVWEQERWKELVFALLTSCSEQTHPALRETVDALEELGLLEVAMLAQAVDPGGTTGGKTTRRIVELLGEEGFSEAEALRSVQTIGEAARVVHEQYRGKIQLYLRQHGERMLREAGQLFRFTHLDDEEAGRALTLWLQNVLTMPVSLNDGTLHDFSRSHDLDPAEVVRAADEIDLNVAVLDDLLQREVVHRAVPEQPPE